ncbi:MAG: glycosyltransferase [Candidatus Zixiibacteriota bacterium]
MAKSTLSKEVRKQIQEIGDVDVLVGIPSYNSARTISHVVRAVSAGLAKYFPKHRTLLINSDGGSADGTQEVVKQTTLDDLDVLLMEHPVYPVHKIVTPHHGMPGKGNAFKTIFKIASALNAKACAVVDSDLRSITPEWIELLIEPILFHGHDFVAPYYKRHKYDGTITNSIVYPLTRALYAKRIRQPIGGDFGFSGRLAQHYLAKRVYDTDVARFGIDIWMTTTAVADGFKVCQSFLGAKLHQAKDPEADLSEMLAQVIGTVFHLMEVYHPVWSEAAGSEAVKEFGFKFDVGLEPIRVNLERMVDSFGQGLSNLSPIWRKMLSPDLMVQLEEVASHHVVDFHLPDAAWVKIVYDFALAYRHRVMARTHILKSLTPLYLGWIASFVNQTMESDAGEVEEKLEALCQEFEKQKTYLLANWDEEVKR